MSRNADIFIQVRRSAVKNELGQLRMVVVLERDRVWLDFSYNVEEFWKDPLPDICSCPTLNQPMFRCFHWSLAEFASRTKVGLV